MNISAPFIIRPIATTLLMLGVAVLGLIAYALLPIAGVPQVDVPTVQVTAALPGASAETMAASVAAPIERQLATIAGISSMNSVNSLGSTSITVQFTLDRKIDAAAQDIQAAISRAGILTVRASRSRPVGQGLPRAKSMAMLDEGKGRIVRRLCTGRSRLRVIGFAPFLLVALAAAPAGAAVATSGSYERGEHVRDVRTGGPAGEALDAIQTLDRANIEHLAGLERAYERMPAGGEMRGRMPPRRAVQRPERSPSRSHRFAHG